MDARDALRAGFIDPGKVVYPESDGQPMAESDAHANELREYAVEVLRHAFGHEPLVYVSGNNFVYWRQGDPRAVVSPDTYVVKGVAMRERPTFKVWEEGGHTPCFVLELTSNSTKDEDLGRKQQIYARELRVAEYFLFDLTGDWIPEKLRGFVLERGRYHPLSTDTGRLPSRELGLDLFVKDGHLRFARRGEVDPIPTKDERIARERAEKERERAEKERALLELEQLRAELKRLQGGG